MDWKLGVLMAALASGCAQQSEAPPIGRYQFMEKHSYDDGTVEYSCLDTATGKISYAVVYQDLKKLKENDFDCSR